MTQSKHDYSLRTGFWFYEYRRRRIFEFVWRRMNGENNSNFRLFVMYLFQINYFVYILHNTVSTWVSILPTYFHKLLECLNLTFSFIAARKLNLLHSILFYGKLDPLCVNGRRQPIATNHSLWRSLAFTVQHKVAGYTHLLIFEYIH
jgi:hypothetical protein